MDPAVLDALQRLLSVSLPHLGGWWAVVGAVALFILQRMTGRGIPSTPQKPAPPPPEDPLFRRLADRLRQIFAERAQVHGDPVDAYVELRDAVEGSLADEIEDEERPAD
jgi:hypothetical protein